MHLSVLQTSNSVKADRPWPETRSLRDREIQCEPPVRAGQRGAVEETVREKTRRAGSDGDPDRRDSSRPASVGSGARHWNQRKKARAGVVTRGDRKRHGGPNLAARPGGAWPKSRQTLLVRDRWGQGAARGD